MNLLMRMCLQLISTHTVSKKNLAYLVTLPHNQCSVCLHKNILHFKCVPYRFAYFNTIFVYALKLTLSPLVDDVLLLLLTLVVCQITVLLGAFCA
jgi:hypothetical protein